MNTKIFRQICFSVLVLALGSWAFYEYRQSQKEQQEEVKSASLFDKKLKELQAFRIIKNDSALEIVKDDQDWHLKKPFPDLADFTEISRWFDEIKNQKMQRIQIKSAVNWEAYYLDQSPAVEMDFSDGTKLSFSVSKKSSFDGKYFVKKGEELFIGESYFSSEVNKKDFDSFRSKKLLPAFGHAVKIQFRGKENFTLYWENYEWSLGKPKKKKPVPLDSKRLDGFWTDVSSMKASSIKERVSPSSLRKYGLNKPRLKILFDYADKDKDHILTLSPLKKDKAFVSVSHRNFIFEISKESAEKLILAKKDLRDHNFPFNYKKELTVQIERKNNQRSFVIKKEKETWKSLSEKTESIDSEKVEELLDKIKELKGEKYKKTGSIKKDGKSIKIKNAGGEIIFELKESSSNSSHYWVKTNLWDELVSVSKTDLDSIFNHKITPDPKVKEEDKKTESKQESKK